MKFDSKESFIDFIKEGVWLNLDTFLVKFKYVDNDLISLWLSKVYSDSMCYSTQYDSGWTIEDGRLVEFSAYTYGFGENTGADTIYDEDTGEIILDRLKDIVINARENKKYNMILDMEFDRIWNAIEKRDFSSFVELKR